MGCVDQTLCLLYVQKKREKSAGTQVLTRISLHTNPICMHENIYILDVEYFEPIYMFIKNKVRGEPEIKGRERERRRGKRIY